MPKLTVKQVRKRVEEMGYEYNSKFVPSRLYKAPENYKIWPRGIHGLLDRANACPDFKTIAAVSAYLDEIERKDKEGK